MSLVFIEQLAQLMIAEHGEYATMEEMTLLEMWELAKETSKFYPVPCSALSYEEQRELGELSAIQFEQGDDASPEPPPPSPAVLKELLDVLTDNLDVPTLDCCAVLACPVKKRWADMVEEEE